MSDLNAGSLQLVRIDNDRLPQLNRFYKRQGHKGRARPEHHSFALQQQGEIVAALRLEPQPWGQLLRGLWVDKTLRGGGLGGQLLRQLHRELSHAPCYCLPYEALANFYRRCGFSDAHQQAPAALRQQWRRYLQRGEQLRLMAYRASLLTTGQPSGDPVTAPATGEYKN